jgi:high-affinity iron transporter
MFLIASTSFLLLIGAGLFSKSIGAFERYKFNTKVSLVVLAHEKGQLFCNLRTGWRGRC